jgi:hypothetical protein
LQHGEELEPFTGKTFPPQWKRHDRTETIIARSRERYTTPRRVVEEKIRRWMQPRGETGRRRNGLRRKPLRGGGGG